MSVSQCVSPALFPIPALLGNSFGLPIRLFSGKYFRWARRKLLKRFNRHHIPGNPMKFLSFSPSSWEAAILVRSGPTPAGPALHSRMATL
jgi:hypothetical protein